MNNEMNKKRFHLYRIPVELNVESALDEASVVTVKSSESDSNVLKESLVQKKVILNHHCNLDLAKIV